MVHPSIIKAYYFGIMNINYHKYLIDIFIMENGPMLNSYAPLDR